MTTGDELAMCYDVVTEIEAAIEAEDEHRAWELFRDGEDRLSNKTRARLLGLIQGLSGSTPATVA